MSNMRPATKAWLVLGIGVLAWELTAPKGELLSHGFDRFLEHHPVITWTATVVTALHLLNAMPPAIDPWRLVHFLRRVND